MKISSKYLSIFLVSLTIASCTSNNSSTVGSYKLGKPYKIADKVYVPKEQPNYDEVGMASWYGSEFHNKKTANGGTFNSKTLTAAHKTLPLPSMVKITNLSNNKSQVVMINDRGPFTKNRIIDVSEKTAEMLGFKSNGTAKVRVQFLPAETKKLLANVPGAKNRKLAVEPIPQNIRSVADETPSDAKLVPKFSPTANEAVVISKVKAKPAAKKESAKDFSDNELEEFSDAENENPATLSNSPPVAKPARNPEQVEEISRDVHFINVGTYSVIENAQRTAKSLASLGDVNTSAVRINGKLLYKVKIGPIMDKKIAELALKKTILLGHPDAVIVSEAGNS